MCAGAPPFGFINAFKPPGLSSTAFGAWVRKRLGAAALGHWGTLDPSAAGVLLLAVGAATKLLPYVSDAAKSYVFELRVGAATDTGDADGVCTRRSPVPDHWSRGLPSAAAALLGPIEQVPPLYSAVKIGGRPLYRAARRGIDVERPARVVRIDALRVLGVDGSSARMSVVCSAGTYVRTLCEELGNRLGLAAHMGFLLRTRAGPFTLADARTPAEIAADPSRCISDPRAALSMPILALGDAEAVRFMHGNPVPFDGGASDVSERDERSLVVNRGAIIGVAGIRDSHAVPLRVLVSGAENG